MSIDIGSGPAEMDAIDLDDHSAATDLGITSATAGILMSKAHYLRPEGKKEKFVDLNLVSGSSDNFRSSMGGFYTVENQPANGLISGQYLGFTHLSPLYPDPKGHAGFPIMSVISLCDLDRIRVPIAGSTKKDTLVPYKRFICAVDGNSSVILNDKYWKLLWTGGTLDDVEIPALYRAGSFDDHSTQGIKPYSQMDIRNFTAAANLSPVDYINDSATAVQISYDYNKYLPLYQAKAITKMTELELTNLYLLKSAIRHAIVGPRAGTDPFDDPLGVDTTADLIPAGSTEVYNFAHQPKMLDFITADGALYAGYDPSSEALPASCIQNLFEEEEKMTYFLDNQYVVHNLSSNTKDYINEKMKNVVFNAAATAEVLPTAWNSSSHMPYCAKISFPPGVGGPIRNLMEGHKLDTRFLLMLKEAFLEQTGDSLSLTPQQYLREVDAQTTTESEAGPLAVRTTEVDQVEYKSIDLFDLLLYSYSKIKFDLEDYTLIETSEVGFSGPDSSQTRAGYDTKGVYRYVNGIATSRTITDVLHTIGTPTSPQTGLFYINDIYSLMNLTLESSDTWVPEYDPTIPGASDKPTSRITETIAYRIEKRGALVTDEGYTQTALQNYWIWNPKSGMAATELIPDLGVSEQPKPRRGVDIIDTQVKYDKDYVYNIYEYKIVHGIKYKFANLQLSRIIGDVRDIDATTFEYIDDYHFIGTEAWCIEYYDPETDDDETVDDLLETSAYSIFAQVDGPGGDGTPPPGMDFIWRTDFGDWINESISSIASPAQRIAVSRHSTFETYTGTDGDSRYSSQKPYFANFVVTVEPSIRIIECPMFSKNIKIKDNPPNNLNIEPTYALDNSNDIIFQINYETFNRLNYPDTVTSIDEEIKTDYLNSNDLLDSTLIETESISNQSYIQVFRLSKKPTSLKDFEGHELDSEIMTIPNMKRRRQIDSLESPVTTSKLAYNDVLFSDTIKSNQKYYYLFRAINELDIPGPPSGIVQAELINDGGYKYALFDVLFPEDLVVDEFDRTTKPIKKVFQIKPSMEQLMLNVDNADFSDTASSQKQNVIVGEAEDSIFDKTFKIRLTSKKTGKKIDLNVTYKKNDDSFS